MIFFCEEISLGDSLTFWSELWRYPETIPEIFSVNPLATANAEDNLDVSSLSFLDK
jgi:hypothetical protein